jgi:hypothetical protein
MTTDSFYRKMLARERVNMGFDYSNGMLSKFVSPRLYGNPMLAEFLNRIDKVIVDMAESIKRVQFYFAFTIDKNDLSINQ